MRAKLLMRVINGKVRLSTDYSPTELTKDLKLELGMKMAYMQAWRMREYVRMLVMGRPEDHYKVLPWMCVAIVRANPDSRAFCEVEGSRFKRMFAAYGASLNGFILGCQKMLFVDGTHLSRLYKGTLMAATALDADNHLFDVAYAVVAGENKEDWLWFLTVVHECIGGLKPVIMSYRSKGLLYAMAKVFGVENHSYCVRHLRENLLGRAAQVGIRRDALKDPLKQMFNRVAYAPTAAEYESALAEPRRYKWELACWVEENEPERWVQLKFLKERWGKLNNNPIESWNYWMCRLRQMSIPSLMSGHL